MFSVENFIKGLNKAGILTERKDEKLILYKKDVYRDKDGNVDTLELGTIPIEDIKKSMEILYKYIPDGNIIPEDINGKYHGTPLYNDTYFEIAINKPIDGWYNSSFHRAPEDELN